MTTPSNPSPGQPMPSETPTPEHDDLDEAYRLSQDFDALTLLIAEHRDSNDAYASAIKEVRALKAALTASNAERDAAKAENVRLRARLDENLLERGALIRKQSERDLEDLKSLPIDAQKLIADLKAELAEVSRQLAAAIKDKDYAWKNTREIDKTRQEEHAALATLRSELDRVTRERDAARGQAIIELDEHLSAVRTGLLDERDAIRASRDTAQAALARANAEAGRLREAAKRHADAVLLFGIARAEYDCERTDENARLVSEASCRQADALEALEKLLSTNPGAEAEDAEDTKRLDFMHEVRDEKLWHIAGPGTRAGQTIREAIDAIRSAREEGW